MNQQQILYELAGYICAEHYHRVNPLTPNVVATDGAIRMAELCKAFWLLDVIASHTSSIDKNEMFAIAHFKMSEPHIFTLADDMPANVTYARQEIEFSDFPLDEIKLYVCRQDEFWVILLPSEY